MSKMSREESLEILKGLCEREGVDSYIAEKLIHGINKSQDEKIIEILYSTMSDSMRKFVRKYIIQFKLI